MTSILESPEHLAKAASKIIIGLAAVVVLLSLTSSFSVIAPGNTGVIFNIWTGSLRSVPGILIQNKTIEKWNGTLPQVTGGAMPMLDLNSFKNAK
jgi:hypothetical protein